MLSQVNNEQMKVLQKRKDSKKSDRLNIMVKKQVEMIRKSQQQLQLLVDEIDACDQEVNLGTLESVKNIVIKSEDLIIMVQIIIKVRNELGHARLDVEKAKRANIQMWVNESRKRVEWLEQRLEELLIECHEQASLLLDSTKIKESSKGLYNTHCATVFQETLPSNQCERLLSNIGGYLRSDEDDVTKLRHHSVAKQVVNNTQKMISEKDELFLGENSDVLQPKLDDEIIVIPDLTLEKDTTEESDGVIQNGTQPMTANEHHQPSGDISHTITVVNDEKSAIASQFSKVSNKKDKPQEDLCSEDETDRYWKSDHHKFEWPEAVKISPLSWNSLGISLQDSFVAKEKPDFDSNLPWREKAIQVNNVLDIHKIALDKLYTKLHNMYDAIEKATQTSINPILKQNKVEPRMALIESRQSYKVEHKNEGNLKDSHLPDIGQNTISVSTPEQKQDSESHSYQTLDLISPKAKTPNMCYPRSSATWCETKAPCQHVGEKIITISKVTPLTKSQLIISKKVEKAQKKEKKEPMSWRPSIVYKMMRATKGLPDTKVCEMASHEVYSLVLKVLQSQVRHWNIARQSDPKWKRVKWLLGPLGLQSGTQDVVISALKTLGKLRCSDDEVGEVLKKMLAQKQDPRIIYEASKTLILSGHWFPTAIEILLHALKFGAKSLKMEILNALFSVTNVPQFYRASLLSRQVKDCLIELVQDVDKSLAFSSALCLGKLSVAEPVAKDFLIHALKSQDYTTNERQQALDLLVREMHCHNQDVISSLLHELSTSINWKVRVKIADLLISLARQGDHKVLGYDREGVFAILERLLWDHAHQEVRSKVAELLNTLKLREQACSIVLKRLDDPVATVRGRAIIALSTLEMRSGKELKALLDILVLDSSVYARIQAMRAFARLKWNDPRILRCLREREKSGGILAKFSLVPIKFSDMTSQRELQISIPSNREARKAINLICAPHN